MQDELVSGELLAIAGVDDDVAELAGPALRKQRRRVDSRNLGGRPVGHETAARRAASYTFRPSLEIDRNGSMFQAYLIDPPLVPSRDRENTLLEHRSKLGYDVP